MKLIRNIFVLILLAVGFKALGQDNHFSQFYNNPVEVNPAFLSTFRHPRIALSHRNQWSNIIRPYKTFKAEGFYPYYNDEQHIGTGGISFLNQTSGNNGLLTTNRITALSSFRFPLDSKNQHALHVGISGNYVNRRINTKNLTSGNQWYNRSYHSNVALGENFDRRQANYLTLSNSFLWNYRDAKGNRKGYAGLSIFNINEPDLEFISREDEYPLRWSVTGGYEVVNEGRWQVFPRLLWMQQAGINEWTGGSNIYYDLDNQASLDYFKKMTLGLGAYYRWDDAFIVSLSARQEKYNAGVSYDINTSDLKEDLGYNSSIEFFLTWKFMGIPEQEKTHRKREKSGKTLILITVEDSATQKRIKADISLYTEEGKGIEKKNGKRMTEKVDPEGKYKVKVEKDGYKEVKKEISLNKYPTHMVEIPVALKKKPDKIPYEIRVVDTSGTLIKDVVVTVKDSAGNYTRNLVEDGVLDTNLVSGGTYNINVNKEGYYKQTKRSVASGEEDKIILESVPEEKPEVLNDVHFEPGTAKLDTASYDALNKVAEKLRLNPEYNITITGHTDSTDTKASNKKLSKKRAQAVADYLIKKGVSKDRIKTRGKGEEDPIAPNATKSGRQRNRRVEINLHK